MFDLWIRWPHGQSSKRNWPLGASPSHEMLRRSQKGSTSRNDRQWSAMYVQNDACFHATQILQHRIVKIMKLPNYEYFTVMTRRFEPRTSLEQILARACWIACNQRRLHYDLLTTLQWALESFSSNVGRKRQHEANRISISWNLVVLATRSWCQTSINSINRGANLLENVGVVWKCIMYLLGSFWPFAVTLWQWDCGVHYQPQACLSVSPKISIRDDDMWV